MTDEIEAADVRHQHAEQSVALAPSEPDWELWYRLHPSACAHVATNYGHCDRCGTCLDTAACAIHRDLQAIYEHPAEFHPVTILAVMREKVAPWLAPIMQILFARR